ALDRALSSDVSGEHDGRFVIPMQGAQGGLTAREATLLARITQPMPLSQALTSRLEAAALDRLIARGLVMIAGVTPSDASHALGRLYAWDAAASEKALKLLGRRRTGAGERFAADPVKLAQAIIDQLTIQTADCLLEAAFGEDPAFADDSPEALARHSLTRAGLRGHSGVIQMTVRLGVSVIGLGASAPAYYGAVGERLDCQMILPEHAGVANAIGAVVGQVSQRATGTVTSPSEGRFAAHLPGGIEVFPDCDAALAALQASLTDDATARALRAGAVDLHLTSTRDIREAEVEGRRMFIEAVLSVTASGRPRVAHTADAQI
ncbi:MAG: hydantoinase/oxoprolinase family protein, partial [Pseudotabrizicola sp.]|nr:hydantoinase/oxoprolinase family protein [Pseudotabrizicola sp.]